MADSDLIKLYSGRLLELAANIPLTGRLPAPQGSARKRSALCGSSISVDVVLRDGRLSEFAQDVRACALGQASAAILGAVVLGRSPAEIATARQQLAAMLEGDAAPEPPFEHYQLLSAAREYRNRHGSIMLALEATCAAIECAMAAQARD